MEFFLVFMLGMALAVVILFVARPGLFAKPNQDFTYFEVMLEEAIVELEQKQQELLEEIEEQRTALLELHGQLLAAYTPKQNQSPKVLAVLELAKDGQDAAAIGKRLGLGTGEVELILELEKDWKPLAEND
ncbi:MAG: hypothetical protein GX956_07060 [Firmicutes bacterium]|nr:hypothetical protein [Bacillota bacterium]